MRQMRTGDIFPITLYGSSISYFTGKLEVYFRLKGIPYELKPLAAGTVARLVKSKTGSAQMPAIELSDGRWMSDSTPIIQWFENEYPTPPIMPGDPLQSFFSLLLEDYADEWLWRPAMHYRWHYDVGARFASSQLTAELTADIRLPAFWKRRMIIRRQRAGYTIGDGITQDQISGVEAIYHRTLTQLQAIFQRRPFLLGARPSLADIGFSGPLFRHFALDPVPAEIMRREAPAVFEWVARMWNSSLDGHTGALVDGIPSDWGPILDEIGQCYLPYLCANIDAVAAGKRRFSTEVGGVSYERARWSPYRVWCMRKLRDHFEALSPGDQETAGALLQQHGCWEPLWRHGELPVNEEFCGGLPFRVDAKMIDVYQ